MKIKRNLFWMRIYLAILAGARTVILLAAVADGFKLYFPNISSQFSLPLLAVTLIFEWIVVIFFESANKWLLMGTLALDGILSYLSGMRAVRRFGSINFFENICFGNIVFVLIDIVLIIIIIYMFNRVKSAKARDFSKTREALQTKNKILK